MNIKMVRLWARLAICLCILSAGHPDAKATTDTVRVMAYNVLYYGNGCQGPTANFHGYLATILRYVNADVISLEKVSSARLTPDDSYGTAPYGFADSILKYAFEQAYPGRYAYCTVTNEAKANNTSLLFYNKSKLGFSEIVATYVNGTDYNTYKLFHVKKANDTSFLYVTCNHTKSGDDFDDVRTLQVTGTMNSLRHHFSQLGNHLFLGDFNARSSDEGFYQVLTAGKDTDFLFYDPPFYPDQKFKYPCNWDHDARYAGYFTTSTRESAGIPNNCGSAGGAKNWYDHIFISRPLTESTNDIHYVRDSYRTTGNDGQRFKVSINNANVHKNQSAPADVINALYRMSNKYPVMADLVIDNDLPGKMVEVPYAQKVEKQDVTILTTTEKKISILFPAELTGQGLIIDCKDRMGAVVLSKKITLEDTSYDLKHKLTKGHYTIVFRGRHNLITTSSLDIP